MFVPERITYVVDCRRLSEQIGLMIYVVVSEWLRATSSYGSPGAKVLTGAVPTPSFLLALLIFSARWMAVVALALHCAWNAGVATEERER